MADTSALTDRQRMIYDFIRNKILNRGFPPTIREIGTQFQIDSPNGVMCHLKALEKKGLIKRDNRSARAIQLTDFASASDSNHLANRGATFPLLGRVAAGSPLDAVEQDDTLDVADLLGGENHFMLQVRGLSMIESHIEDGDYVIIRKQESAANGETVVAKVDGEVTLKKFYKKPDHIILQPANGTMSPIRVDPTNEVQVLGKLIGVVRKC